MGAQQRHPSLGRERRHAPRAALALRFARRRGHGPGAALRRGQHQLWARGDQARDLRDIHRALALLDAAHSVGPLVGLDMRGRKHCGEFPC